jgi:hypothetical protein
MSVVILIEQSNQKCLAIKERAICVQCNALKGMSVLYTIVEFLVSLEFRTGESLVSALYL